MAEEKKKSRAEKMYGERKMAHGGKETEPKPKAEEKKEEGAETKAKGEKDEKPQELNETDGKGEHEHHERHREERHAMVKRHETEIRDHHGNVREERRKIHHRHEAEHKALNEKQMAEMATGGEPAAAGPDGQAPAVAAVPAAPAPMAA